MGSQKNAGKPLILEIKANSLDDGPGIRSVIFFKGCPPLLCLVPKSRGKIGSCGNRL